MNLRPKPLHVAGTAQAEREPNRFSYWIAAIAMFPDGSSTWITEEIAANAPVHQGQQIKGLENALGQRFASATPEGIPILGGKHQPRINVVSFQLLRAWYEHEPAEPGEVGA